MTYLQMQFPDNQMIIICQIYLFISNRRYLNYGNVPFFITRSQVVLTPKGLLLHACPFSKIINNISFKLDDYRTVVLFIPHL